jgi:hypothetical protein
MKQLKKQEIYDKKNLLVVVLRAGEYPPGTKFYSREKDYLQAGTWNHSKGHRIKAHSHRIFKRTSLKTQEIVFLLTGKMRSNIYDKKGKFLTRVILKPKDIIIYLDGGHDFEILENKTRVFEVKNGPYLGVEKDKKFIQ